MITAADLEAARALVAKRCPACGGSRVFDYESGPERCMACLGTGTQVSPDTFRKTITALLDEVTALRAALRRSLEIARNLDVVDEHYYELSELAELAR